MSLYNNSLRNIPQANPQAGAAMPSARAAAVLESASEPGDSPRARATAAATCGRYAGSLRREAGFGSQVARQQVRPVGLDQQPLRRNARHERARCAPRRSSQIQPVMPMCEIQRPDSARSSCALPVKQCATAPRDRARDARAGSRRSPRAHRADAGTPACRRARPARAAAGMPRAARRAARSRGSSRGRIRRRRPLRGVRASSSSSAARPASSSVRVMRMHPGGGEQRTAVRARQLQRLRRCSPGSSQ